MPTADTFWSSCLGHFAKELSVQQFNTWIKPLRLDFSDSAPDKLTLVAPNRFVLQWVKENFLSRIEQMAENHLSRIIQFQLTLADQAGTKTTSLTGESNANPR